jgi:serine/threonine protein kinase
MSAVARKMKGAGDRAMTEKAPKAALNIEPGVLLAGKYRVEAEIGSGGMGIVVSARHVAMGHRLAIKILRIQEDERDLHGAVARFVREARAAARIQSDHVVRVTDVAALPDGTPYMVMEYLEGEDLRQLLARRGELDVEEAVGHILQACEGLAEAHAAGVIHRDLKPSNLFLSRRAGGQVVLKILDFGISKVAPRPGEAGITTTGALMGSPLYMAPEQMRSTKKVDERADIWSLGLILYELLAGSPPFEGETIPEVCVAVMSAPPLPISEFRTDVPKDLQAILLKCLAKDPKDRYRTMGELARALHTFAPASARVHADRASATAKTARTHPSVVIDDSPGVPAESVARPRQAGSIPDEGAVALRRPEPESLPSWSAGRPRPRRARAMWIAIGAAACALAIVVGAVVARSKAPESGAQSTAVTAPVAPPPLPTPEPRITADVPSVPFDSLPVASHEAPGPRSPAPPAIPARKIAPAPSAPPPPAKAAPAPSPTPPAASAGQKDGWQWGDRN